MRYKLKRDEYHTQIAAELITAGFSVLDLSRVGEGCPDLLIARNNVSVLVEIKTAIGRKAAIDRLRPNQVSFIKNWKGPVIVAYNVSEISYEFNLLLKRRSSYAV